MTNDVISFSPFEQKYRSLRDSFKNLFYQLFDGITVLWPIYKHQRTM